MNIAGIEFEQLFVNLVYAVVTVTFVFTLDDLFIDLVALVRRLKPRRISLKELMGMTETRQKNIAIMIANWKEAEVIAPMIRGNIRGIKYENYTFFLGVYPNDTETWREAKKLEELFPQRVMVVVNSMQGPTSKGQMLNEMARRILESEVVSGIQYDLFLMQDSEDVLHPYSLTLLNQFSSQSEFIQIPVFSFDVPKRSLVAGVYIDEFSESHTKDLLVRQELGAAIPSAGVGTLLSRELMLSAMLLQGGNFLKEDTLTEDYHLGIMTKIMGFRSRFLCVQIEMPRGSKEFIATREYFPSDFFASIRQKSRWTLGIAYQGLDNIQWQGSWVDRYFLLRDRKGPLNSALVILSVIVLLGLAGFRLLSGRVPEMLNNPVFDTLIVLNAVNMLLRVFQRMWAVRRVNGWTQALMVPVRWLVANVVNVAATIKAHRTYRHSLKTGQKPAWVKTDHRLPAHFGKEVEVQTQ
ncbi:glycosyltransferase [Bdellovibrio sp.]|uniref:glycosyltransferase n=1 Tax=Bdellovibrio sp. TaxID=28201 RepID=UPI0039E4B156